MASKKCMIGYFKEGELKRAYIIETIPKPNIITGLTKLYDSDEVVIFCKRWWIPHFYAKGYVKEANQWREVELSVNDKKVKELRRLMEQGIVDYSH